MYERTCISNCVYSLYRATQASCRTLGSEDLLLLDSGAQYADGTTGKLGVVRTAVPWQNFTTLPVPVLVVVLVHACVLLHLCTWFDA
jgi:hypothetical protein